MLNIFQRELRFYLFLLSDPKDLSVARSSFCFLLKDKFWLSIKMELTDKPRKQICLLYPKRFNIQSVLQE